MAYKIVRFYMEPHRNTSPSCSAKSTCGPLSRIIKRGLTLEQAQSHCRSPESSSRTATSAAARRRTRTYGPWFDGYDVDDRT
jgi:hypothetical protein